MVYCKDPNSLCLMAKTVHAAVVVTYGWDDCIQTMYDGEFLR